MERWRPLQAVGRTPSRSRRAGGPEGQQGTEPARLRGWGTAWGSAQAQPRSRAGRARSWLLHTSPLRSRWAQALGVTAGTHWPSPATVVCRGLGAISAIAFCSWQT